MTTSPKLYELSMIEAIAGGDQDFIQTMLQLFIDTMPQSMKELQEHAANADWELMGKTAHKMKSTIDSMGIIELKQDIRTLENNGKQQTDLDKVPAQVAHVVRILEQVIEQLKNDFSL